MNLMFFDIEYTAWEGSKQHNWSRPGEHREVIQVGAVEVDLETQEITKTMLEFVRPTINGILSQYIIDLTGVTQNDVDTKGITFESALDKLNAFCGSSEVWVYGPTDLDVLKENLRLNNLEHDSINHWVVADVAPNFREAGIDTSKIYTNELSALFGVANTGRAHNALSDAESLARASMVLIDRGIIDNPMHAQSKSSSAKLRYLHFS